MQKLALVALLIASALTVTAQAQTYYRTPTNAVFGVGLTPTTRLALAYPLLRQTSVRAGACGEVVIRLTNPAETKVKIGTTIVDLALLPQALLPACDALTATFAEARTANFKTYDDRVVIVGQTPGSFYTVGATQTRNLTANGCGFVTAAPSTTYPQLGTTEIQIGTGAVAAISTLPEKELPICRTVNALSTGYYPASWLTP